jgi:hypothetical protein
VGSNPTASANHPIFHLMQSLAFKRGLMQLVQHLQGFAGVLRWVRPRWLLQPLAI